MSLAKKKIGLLSALLKSNKGKTTFGLANQYQNGEDQIYHPYTSIKNSFGRILEKGFEGQDKEGEK